MSYFWLGGKYMKPPADQKLGENYPAMKYYTRYKESLYCFVKIKENGHIVIEGKTSVFIDGTPKERGFPFNAVSEETVSASITNRHIKP